MIIHFVTVSFGTCKSFIPVMTSRLVFLVPFFFQVVLVPFRVDDYFTKTSKSFLTLIIVDDKPIE